MPTSDIGATRTRTGRRTAATARPTHRTLPAADVARLRRTAAMAFGLALLALLVTGSALLTADVIGPVAFCAALAFVASVAGVAAAGLPQHGHARFGAANAVTTGRTVLTALCLSLVPAFGDEPPLPPDRVAAGVALVALTALLLDGIDGWFARRQRLASPFGARFDMEIDAALMLVLSLFVFSSGKAGIAVVAIGLMRYAFVAAQAFMPKLRAELAPSLRRKAICALEVAVLCLLVSPLVAPPHSEGIAIAASLALAASFALDLRALLSRPARP